MKLKVAAPGDAADVSRLVRDSFFDYPVDAMIYGCFGIVRYLQDLFGSELRISDTSTFIWPGKGQPEAVVQYRRRLEVNCLHLNYICLSKNIQGRRLASKILLESLEVEDSALQIITLDVFDTNGIAVNWYKGLGFEEYRNTSWNVIELADSPANLGFISGFPQNALCYSTYGFCNFTLTTATCLYNVGLMGEKYFRVTDERILLDKSAIATLKMFDCDRKFLFVGRLPSEMAIVENTLLATVSSLSLGRDAAVKKLKSRFAENGDCL